MATPNTPAAPAPKISTVLSTLAETNAYVQLGLEVAGIVVPIGKALIQEIKQITTKQDTVAYQVLVQMDETDLQAVVSLDIAEIVAINAELTRLGKPTLPVPAAPVPVAEPAPASPAPAPAPATTGPASGSGGQSEAAGKPTDNAPQS